MLSIQFHRNRTSSLSPKAALRAHVEQLSADKKREFVSLALELIAARSLIDEAEAQLLHNQPGYNSTHVTLN